MDNHKRQRRFEGEASRALPVEGATRAPTIANWNSLKLIQWTTDFFKKKGIPNPRVDTELLLAHTLNVKRIDLYINHEKIIPQKDLDHFRSLIERRIKREPLQYIVKETEFWGHKIFVTPDVLIPRPETELLVQEVLQRFNLDVSGSTGSFRSRTSRKPENKYDENADNGRAASERDRLSVTEETEIARLNLLDIGTGSGCISIALAKQIPTAQITATDISPKALEVAGKNIQHHQLENQIHTLLADIAPWRVFQAENRMFDLIVSNPPYIAEEEYATLQPEVRDFEPKTALISGNKGLQHLETIIQESRPFLKKDGFLILEIGEGQAEILNQHSFASVHFVKDYQGIPRIAVFKP